MEIKQSTTSITHRLIISNFRDGEDVELRGNGNYWERLYGEDWSEFELTDQEKSAILHYLLHKKFSYNTWYKNRS